MNTSLLALNLAFQTHYGYLIHWCRRLVSRQLADPEDIVHAAYLRVQGRFRVEQVSRERPLAYLKQAIRWEAADRRRCQRSRQRHARELLNRHSTIDSAEPATIVAVHESLERLTGGSRLVCQALLAGKSHRQLCREFQLTAGALAVCLCRAHRRLLRLLQE